MPKIHDDKSTAVSPEAVLAPYQHHGLRFDIRGEQAYADCPFCNKENKFSLNIPKQQWRCLVCSQGSTNGGGNLLTFFRTFWDGAILPEGRAKKLSKERGISVETFIRWGLKVHPLLDTWMLPGYNADRKLCNLYTWLKDKVKDGEARYSFHATRGVGHQLHMPLDFRGSVENILCTEGPWDGMKLDESLRLCKVNSEGDYEPTSNQEASLWAENEVVAVPGCGTFMERHFPLYEGKCLHFVFDNDHDRPIPKTDRVVNPGYDGMKGAVKRLSKAQAKVKETLYLPWGGEGKQFNPGLPDGHDVRDELNKASDRATLATILGEMISKIVPTPQDWCFGVTPAEKAKSGSAEMTPLTCTDWETCETAWKVAFDWTDDYSIGMSIMLAANLAIETQGCPLFLRIIGPPSSGKTTLCEGLDVAKDYVRTESTFTGFISGYDKGDGEDHSLIAKLVGPPSKMFIIKEGNTLLTSPRLKELLSDLRDAFDGKMSKYFKTGLPRSFDNYTIGNIIAGTHDMYQLDSADLGMRHLTCIVANNIPADIEDRTGWRVVNRAWRNAGVERNCSAASHRDEDLGHAMRLTGGFVEHLRRNAVRIIDQVTGTEDDLRLCMRYGTFVSYLRSRPAKNREESKDIREMPYRLQEQFARLMRCVAGVLGKTTVDAEVRRRVLKVVKDTAHGRTLSIVQILHKVGQKGMEDAELSTFTRESPLKDKGMLRFLKSIKAVETFLVKSKRENHPRTRWRLTGRMVSLCTAVFGPVSTGEMVPHEDSTHDD